MPPRRKKTDPPRRHWSLVLLFAAGILAGVALWAYAPTLPAELLIARYADQRSKLIDVGGVEAHVRDYVRDYVRDPATGPASGPAAGQNESDAIPLVLVHGSLGSLHVWEDWARELGPHYRLITVDLPGHGLTGAWPRDEYTIEAYTDFVEVLVDTLRLDRFVLVGHSMGGAVAWSFAATRPDRVSHLVLVDAAGYPRKGEAPLPTRLARMPVVGDIGIYFKPERIVRRSLAEAYADPAMATPERIRRYAELQRFPGNREATLQRARTQEPLDPTPLKRLDVPTLIIWGARDRWVPVADAFRFQNDIKGARLEIFENLGHNPMEEDPQATAAAVAAFLAATPPRPVWRPRAPEPAGTAPAADPTADPAPDPTTVLPAVVPEKD